MSERPSEAAQSGSSSKAETIQPEAPRKDPALELKLPRSDAKDFAAMAMHYGFGDYGTPQLDNFPSAGWSQILKEDKHQVQYLKAVLKGRGCTRDEWYGLNEASGIRVQGSFRSKSNVLCATLPLGIYTVVERRGDRLVLTQSNEVKGTALWPDDWRTLMGAMPHHVLLEVAGLGNTTISADDRVSFIGIQTAVIDGEVFTPVVRPLGVRNETTSEFFNLENSASPSGDLPEVAKIQEAKVAAEAAAKAEAEKKAQDERDEAERALQRQTKDKELLDGLKSKQPAKDAADPFAETGDFSKVTSASVPADLTSAKAELEKVTSTISSEQARWREALATINRLTVNKTKPVVQGSPAYHQCMEASRTIAEVEQGAQALKDRKDKLEARVKEMRE